MKACELCTAELPVSAVYLIVNTTRFRGTRPQSLIALSGRVLITPPYTKISDILISYTFIVCNFAFKTGFTLSLSLIHNFKFSAVLTNVLIVFSIIIYVFPKCYIVLKFLCL